LTAQRETGLLVKGLESARVGGELEDEAHLCAGLAHRAQARERSGLGQGHGAEQGAPREQDRQAIREAGQLSWSIVESKPPEENVRLRAARGPMQVVCNGADADEQRVRLHLRGPADERSVTGTEVDVDHREATSQLGQSSTVYPALLLAFDEVHERRV